MLFRRSDLPLDRDPSGRFIPWLVGLMVYLAALALACAIVMGKIVERWDVGLSGSMTVQIPAPELAGSEANASLEKIIDILLATQGVVSAKVLEPDEIAELLEPWLGSEASYDNLPLPALIAVGIDPAAPPDMVELSSRLSDAVPGTVLDDHQSWLGKLLNLAHSIELVAMLVVLLVGASAVTLVVFATRMGLAIHSRVIELLHLIGAQDAYVAREFQAHAMKMALRGGAAGLALAGLTIFGIERVFARMEAALVPEITLQPVEWVMFALLPLLVSFIAMLTARLTVLRTLGRMP